jgi:hypothetical protein
MGAAVGKFGLNNGRGRKGCKSSLQTSTVVNSGKLRVGCIFNGDIRGDNLI